jgi:hypothetical protein
LSDMVNQCRRKSPISSPATWTAARCRVIYEQSVC